ncbi:15994_t:CDS:2, partial [Dentiscutata erythropus]
MFDWLIQNQINQFHDIFHTAPDQIPAEHRNNFHLFRDLSCTLCYPSAAFLSARFLTFRNWFRLNTSLVSHTQISVNCFQQLLAETDPNRIEPRIDNLLKTLRFRNREQRDILINLLTNCLDYTQRFTVNLNQLNNLQNLAAPTDTEDSEDNLEEPNIMNNQNNMNQLFNYLNRIVEQQNLRNIIPLPTFAGGNQDPVEWLEEFNRCADINRYENADKLNSVNGYLMNEARTWFDEVDSNVAISFQSWQNRMELNNKLQQPHETVHQYAQTIRKLIKKADAGLRREIATQVASQLTFQPNATFEQVIEAASQMENHGRLYPETLQPQVPPSQNAITNDSRPRKPRDPATCYKCRQPGHIARNCPTNQQLPQQSQVFQILQYQLPPQQQMAPQNNNVPQQQNNTGGNVFVTTGNIPQQMPQAQNQLPPQQSTSHPLRTPTEREVTGVFIPPVQNNKREEAKITRNPPEKKSKKKRFKGPDKSCWYNIKLITKEDECKQCEEDYNRWCTLQVIPIQDIRSVQANLVMGGSERLAFNEHKND